MQPNPLPAAEPVHEHGGLWWFWDESTWLGRTGPYYTHAEATAAHRYHRRSLPPGAPTEELMP